MPFIGNPITSQFQARTATQEFNGNGSTTTFTLNQAVTQEDIRFHGHLYVKNQRRQLFKRSC